MVKDKKAQKQDYSVTDVLNRLFKSITIESKGDTRNIFHEPVVAYGEAITISDYYIPVIAKKGVTPEAAELVAENLNLSQKEISAMLHMSDRSFRNHIRQGTLFTGMEAEMIITLLNLVQEGMETFGDMKRFQLWLSLELEVLDYQRTISFLHTISGTRYIIELLKSIQGGAFA